VSCLERFVQDQGQYGQAEAAFLQAGKPREAIDMFLHQRMWQEALRIAEAHDAAAVPAIFLKQAEVLAQEDRLHEAEATYLLVCCMTQLIALFTILCCMCHIHCFIVLLAGCECILSC
jgi:intraflagellar transport protein 172